jgi:hypothetical protein
MITAIIASNPHPHYAKPKRSAALFRFAKPHPLAKPAWLSACAQAAHKHHRVILHVAFGLLILDLGQHMFHPCAVVCAHVGLTASGQWGAMLATATEYLRGSEPPL